MSTSSRKPVILASLPGVLNTSNMKTVTAIKVESVAGSQYLTVAPRPYIVRNVSADDDSSDGEDFTEKRPTRKRQRLDHLSPEEKLQRRKLKNRVAAQTARDRKKARMDDLELTVERVENELAKMKTENELLWKLNANLKSENEALKAELEKKKKNPSAKDTAYSQLVAEVKSEKPVDPAAVISAPQPREQGFRRSPPLATSGLQSRHAKAFSSLLPYLIMSLMSESGKSAPPLKPLSALPSVSSTTSVPKASPTEAKTVTKAGTRSLPNLRPFSPLTRWPTNSRPERLARNVMRMVARRKPPPLLKKS